MFSRGARQAFLSRPFSALYRLYARARPRVKKLIDAIAVCGEESFECGSNKYSRFIPRIGLVEFIEELIMIYVIIDLRNY